MTDRDGVRDEDVELLRGRLHQLVEDVEPRGDALPKLLSAIRRRRLPRSRPLLAAGGAAVAATAVFLVALLVFPHAPERDAEPVSVRPNSYVAAAGDGAVASFDVVTGRRLGEVGRVPGAVVGPLAADGHRVFAMVANGPHREVVEVAGSRRVASVGPDSSATALAAGGGRVAYLDGGAIAVTGPGAERSIPVPDERIVVDLALDGGGRLAVLTTAPEPGRPGTGTAGSGQTAMHIVEPDATSMTDRPAISTTAECGPIAVAWTGQDLVAAQPVDCAATRTRIATLDGDSGARIGAGVPFETGALDAGQVQLSTDRLGRSLLATTGSRQWLVDGSEVLTVPAPCTSGGGCAGSPGTFRG